jgi:hypothetical protein
MRVAGSWSKRLQCRESSETVLYPQIIIILISYIITRQLKGAKAPVIPFKEKIKQPFSTSLSLSHTRSLSLSPSLPHSRSLSDRSERKRER